MATVSYSSITTHRQCPQRWKYRYSDRLETATFASVHLTFGSWWHALRALDSVERGVMHGTLRYAPEEIRPLGKFVEGPVLPPQGGASAVLAAAEAWERTWSEKRQEVWTETLGEGLTARLLWLDSSWRSAYADDLETEHPVAVELPVERALTGTSPLIGFVDEIFSDSRRGLTVVRDHKTSKTLPLTSSMDDLSDSQLSLYAWAAAPQVEEWGLPPIAATSYDRVRSVKPTAPRLTQTGTLSKVATDFDLRTYVEWVGEGVPFSGPIGRKKGGGTYLPDAKLIESLEAPRNASKWFQRTLTPLNRNVVVAHLEAAVDSAEDIKRTRERAVDHGSVGRNFGKACSWCEFSSLCRAQMLGGASAELDLRFHGLRKQAAR
jgi:hypothetical protein